MAHSLTEMEDELDDKSSSSDIQIHMVSYEDVPFDREGTKIGTPPLPPLIIPADEVRSYCSRGDFSFSLWLLLCFSVSLCTPWEHWSPKSVSYCILVP